MLQARLEHLLASSTLPRLCTQLALSVLSQLAVRVIQLAVCTAELALYVHTASQIQSGAAPAHSQLVAAESCLGFVQ